MKLPDRRALASALAGAASKNQNPRKGIETQHLPVDGYVKPVSIASKNQNPRKGIETDITDPALIAAAARASKNQNPRKGIETKLAQHTQVHLFFGFKKPKSPQGD